MELYSPEVWQLAPGRASAKVPRQGRCAAPRWRSSGLVFPQEPGGSAEVTPNVSIGNSSILDDSGLFYWI